MTKTLVIIRHAKSTWDYGPISDFDRPLKEVGIGNTILVASKIKSLGIFPDLIVSSPAIRALHTALITARELSYPAGLVRIDPGFYNESDDEVLGLIRITDDSVNTLFVFGHNPAFTHLPNTFLKQQVDNVPTSGAVILTFETDSWKGISKKTYRTEVCLFPKLLNS